MALTRGPGLTNGRRLVRGFGVLVFAAGLVQSGARVVGTRFEPVLITPAVVAVLLGWLTSRLPLMFRAVAQAAGFVASGLAVAFTAGGHASDFTKGLTNGPRQVITTAWPSPRFVTIFVALGALIYVATAVAIDLAMRWRWRALAIAPLTIGLVVLIAAGSPDGPQWQAVVAATAAAFILLWIGLDDRVASIRSGVPVVVATGLAALVATLGVSVAVDARANPRHGQSANRELALLDPLAEVTAQQKATPARNLYEVKSSALTSMRRWRLAALDVYNGESWSASGKLTPVGNRLDTGTAAPDASVTITARDTDTSLWVSPGRVLRSSSPVETDAQRRVVRIIGTGRPAVTIFTVEAATTFDASSDGSLGSIQPTEIESSYLQFARNLLGGSTTGTIASQVVKLATTLHDAYKYDSNRTGGVQQKLIDDFLRNDKIGNAEQFVTAFVLLARSLGVDARVATGYEIQPASTSATISTSDAIAWPEVRVNGVWMAVDVLPPDTPDLGKAETPAARPVTPAAGQPIDPPEIDNPTSDEPVQTPPVVRSPSRWAEVRVWLLRGGLFTGLLLWPFVVFAIVVTWRKVRRRRGLHAADPARRVSTAWVLATDALVDAGATLHVSHTNAELVAVGAQVQPTAGPPLGRLQRHADAVTFTSTPCDADRAADAVEQLHTLESNIRNSSTRWWRWKWWLSTRSLRSRTQSPLR